ncbi:hypothetical protein M436DRAFT_42482 [Aureobasidium namibiae CBS 147.97]|uniref:Uncharacterized protein n=1 Tax=Aureobasidium namibiae CBS 147.97 TaxID=1043004 RepID=A0A074WPS2_9PEZI|nr:uncharacterized protein M436DRAFT_42482 [Aureobasidium namibiae CBS 147.97]KEQ75108.1 hypothetical protein M436DRAFT_42482 [Aureobasidium namibiae CBS 147.97]
MAEEDSPTMEIPLRAAKGVSQFFLFEALRTGRDEFRITTSQLGDARDKAEKMLAQESPVEFESLIRDILDTCAKSLQTHAAIIEAIAETLRGDADDHDESGKEKINKSSLLVAQIKDAAAGMEELRDVKEKSPPLPTESDFDSEPEVLSSKRSKARGVEEATLPKKEKTKTKHAPNTSAPITENASPEVLDDKTMKGKGKKLSKPSRMSASKAPEGAEESVKMKAAKVKHSSQSSETTLEEKLDTSMVDNDSPPETPKPVSAQHTLVVDDNDINAEVDARLAAKEAKRAKKKEAKKRKRDSVASDIFSPDPKAEPAHITPLPAKKKARVDKDDGDVKEKRQSVDDTPSSKVKTKKQKTDGTIEKAEKTVEANKAKRRRSSNTIAADAPTAVPQTNNRNKKRKVGF